MVILLSFCDNEPVLIRSCVTYDYYAQLHVLKVRTVFLPISVLKEYTSRLLSAASRSANHGQISHICIRFNEFSFFSWKLSGLHSFYLYSYLKVATQRNPYCPRLSKTLIPHARTSDASLSENLMFTFIFDVLCTNSITQPWLDMFLLPPNFFGHRELHLRSRWPWSHNRSRSVACYQPCSYPFVHFTISPTYLLPIRENSTSLSDSNTWHSSSRKTKANKSSGFAWESFVCQYWSDVRPRMACWPCQAVHEKTGEDHMILTPFPRGLIGLVALSVRSKLFLGSAELVCGGLV